MLKTTGKVPDLMLKVTYSTDHGTQVYHQVFMYPGEDAQNILSDAWKPTALEAELFKLTYTHELSFTPNTKAGTWK